MFYSYQKYTAYARNTIAISLYQAIEMLLLVAQLSTSSLTATQFFPAPLNTESFPLDVPIRCPQPYAQRYLRRTPPLCSAPNRTYQNCHEGIEVMQAIFNWDEVTILIHVLQTSGNGLGNRKLSNFLFR
jgi:hypothetical protein